jgi:hypothetical protein
MLHLACLFVSFLSTLRQGMQELLFNQFRMDLIRSLSCFFFERYRNNIPTTIENDHALEQKP